MSIKLGKIIRANDTQVILMVDSMAHLKQFQLNRFISGILLINGFSELLCIIDLVNARIYPFEKQLPSLYFESAAEVKRYNPCSQEVTVQSRGSPINK